MLHIILGILKVIGIILGILLLILLVVFLSLVFVPLRYRITVKKKPQEDGAGQPPGIRITTEAKVSWLLHICSLKVSADLPGEPDIAVRLFGIRLPLFRKKQTISEKPRKIERIETASPEYGEKVNTESPPEENEKVCRAEPLEENETAYRDDPPEENEITYREEPSEKKESERQSRSIIKTVYDKIRKILRRIWTFLTGLTEVPERLSRIRDKAAGILRRPQKLLELAKKLEAQALLGDVLGYLQYLLRHYKPRRIAGYLRIGAGDPALSAQLTGLIYLFLPARADKFTIHTEFNDFVFETEMICSGHIRVSHGIRVLWQAFRNKKLRRLIRYLRKRDQSKGD